MRPDDEVSGTASAAPAASSASLRLQPFDLGSKLGPAGPQALLRSEDETVADLPNQGVRLTRLEVARGPRHRGDSVVGPKGRRARSVEIVRSVFCQVRELPVHVDRHQIRLVVAEGCNQALAQGRVVVRRGVPRQELGICVVVPEAKTPPRVCKGVAVALERYRGLGDRWVETGNDRERRRCHLSSVSDGREAACSAAATTPDGGRGGSA